MKSTHNFTSVEKEGKILANPRDFVNETYAERLDDILGLYDLAKKILLSYKKNYEELDAVSGEEKEAYTLEELRELEYMEDIDRIVWGSIEPMCEEIGVQMYFRTLSCEELFVTTLLRFKNICLNIKQRIDHAVDVKFEKDYHKELLKVLTNMNYCIMCCIDGFNYIRTGESYNFLKFYSVMKDDKIQSKIQDMYEMYLVAKPSLPLFDKYPELAIRLEAVLGEDTFFELANNSERLSAGDLEDIASGRVVVDDAYFENLRERDEE